MLKWIDRTKGTAEYTHPFTEEVRHIQLHKEGIAYFNIEGCTCGMVPIIELDKIIVSGQDDCPVHGFGDGHE